MSCCLTSSLRVTRQVTCTSLRLIQCVRRAQISSTTTYSKAKGKQSSNMWLQRQMRDPYVKQAELDDYRCRSAYKLLEMNEKYKLMSPGNVAIDCGASPGSWSQVASNAVHSSDGQGLVIGIDLLPIEPLEDVTFLTKKDFTADATQREILDLLHNRLANIVLSDMAPNASGNKGLDQDSICELCLMVLKFSAKVLNHEGHVVCKLWEGPGKDNLIKIMERMFKSTKIAKPKASRMDSSEIYLIGQGFKLR